jgi:hypothetical protein
MPINKASLIGAIIRQANREDRASTHARNGRDAQAMDAVADELVKLSALME